MSIRFVAIVTALFVAGAAVAVAAAGIPGPNGEIQGCYNKNTGDLRVVSDPTQCKSFETALPWSQTGPTGPQGPRGVTGDRGDTGPIGPEGLVWRGQYSSATAYAVNDAVQSGGSSYLAVAPVTPTTCTGICLDANAPGLSAKWQLLASQGGTGAAGATGAAGTTGATGAQGPAVLPAAYESYRFQSDPLPPRTVGDMVLADIALPAGSFVVIADARFLNFNGGTLVDNDRLVACTLAETGTTGFNNGTVAYMTIPGLSKSYGSVPLLTGYTRGSPTTIELRCRVEDSSQSPSAVWANGVDLIAIPVSSLTFKRMENVP